MYLVHHLSDTISVHGREGARHEVDSVIRAVQSLRSAQVCHKRPSRIEIKETYYYLHASEARPLALKTSSRAFGASSNVQSLSSSAHVPVPTTRRAALKDSETTTPPPSWALRLSTLISDAACAGTASIESLNCTIVRRGDARRFGFPAKLPSPIKSPISSTTPGGSRTSSLLSIKKSSSSVEPECLATTVKRRTVLRERERERERESARARAINI